MKAFVVGNIAADETYAVTRLPSEGQSIFGSKVSTDLGGKGANQAIILGRSGIPTILVAALGADAQAELLRDRLAPEAVMQRLVTMPDRASDSSLVVKETTGRNVIITTVDCARSLTFDDVSSRMSDCEPGDLLVLQGNLNLETTSRVMSLARARGLRIVLNPSPFEKGIEAVFGDVNILFVNQHEARDLTNHHAEEAIDALLAYGIDTVILSLGEDGVLLGTKGGHEAIPAQTCIVTDSTGAGDTLQGVALASAALRQTDIDARALAHATQAAALTVSRAGTSAAFPTKEEIAELLHAKPERP